MLKGSGTTTRMLKEALRLVTTATNDMPIIIVGHNHGHVRVLMEMFGRLAWDSGYSIKACGKWEYLVDHEARVEFKVPSQLNRLCGRRFIELFVDHYTEECLPLDKKLEFVRPSDSLKPIFELSWQL
jgi:hypothetical protein